MDRPPWRCHHREPRRRDGWGWGLGRLVASAFRTTACTLCLARKSSLLWATSTTVGGLWIAVLAPPEAPPISVGVGAGTQRPRLAHSNACLSAEVQSKCRTCGCFDPWLAGPRRGVQSTMSPVTDQLVGNLIAAATIHRRDAIIGTCHAPKFSALALSIRHPETQISQPLYRGLPGFVAWSHHCSRM
jgi:hypothetical protein